MSIEQKLEDILDNIENNEKTTRFLYRIGLAITVFVFATTPNPSWQLLTLMAVAFVFTAYKS